MLVKTKNKQNKIGVKGQRAAAHNTEWLQAVKIQE